jgi:hypothetical protein
MCLRVLGRLVPEAGGRTMKSRQTVIDQIKALLSKTTANGCTEAEELAALAKVAAMRDAYVVTDEELALTKDEAAILHNDPPDLTDPHGIKWRLSYAVSQFCDVKIYRYRRETGLNAIGLPSDVHFAIWLLDHLANFVFAQLMEYLIADCAPSHERRITIRSFVEGATDRISERLIELAERSKTAQTSNGRELVVVKESAITAMMKKLDLRLGTCRQRSASTINVAAHAAGRAAGDLSTFGRPISGSSGMLRIAKCASKY